jgi:5'-3' exonuclease
MLVLIDTSYTSFYRFFATLRWMSMAEPDEYKLYKNDNKYDWSLNTIFIEKYKKMYMESIIKLIKKKQFDKSTIIFCMDAPRDTLWRNSLSDKYKSDRADMSLKNNFKSVFDYTYSTLIPHIIKSHTNIHKMKVDKMEADDIIATITIHSDKVIIVSGDNDFLQLGREGVQFINYKSKKFIEHDKLEAAKILENKIIIGDKSDNISGIFDKKISAAKRKELLADKKLFDAYLAENPMVKKQYEMNRKMIDFNCIPVRYVNKIMAEYKLLNL